MIDLIASQIKISGNKIGVPIIRHEKEFVIYENGVPLPFPKRPFEKFLLMVCEYIGVNEETLQNPEFRNGLFGACWRMLYDKLEEPIVPQKHTRSTAPFSDIFTKLESSEHVKPNTPIREVWANVAPDLFVCKITNKKLTEKEYSRYQLAKGGAINFITEFQKS